MSDELRIYVPTYDGQPSFLVSDCARDAFISSKVHELYGPQEDGTGHEWTTEKPELPVVELIHLKAA